MPQLLCSRPHAKTLDFRTARFVVSKACGLDVVINGTVRHLEAGAEVPQGSLDEVALRQIYEPPLARIEVLEHALQDPELSPLMRGTAPKVLLSTEPSAPVDSPAPSLAEQLDSLTRRELVTLCEKHGIKADGTKAELRSRLLAVVE